MATALELTREGWRSYAKSASRRTTTLELTPEDKKERDRLLSLAREVSDLLKDRFGVRRVILFGSLAQVSWFTRGSDIDLAVEGLTGKDYWEAWKLAEATFRDRRVDFVEIETTTESVKHAINRHGIEL